MLEGKLQKKYDFFTFNSELKIPPENNSNEDQSKDMIQNSNSIIEEELNQYNNQFKIENSTFIIKEKNKLIMIFSIDKDLPSKIEEKKNTYFIPLSSPLLQAISFMHKSKDESIIISTGNSIDNIKVFKFELKKLMHKEYYVSLDNIENSLKIIPIENSLALVLHYSTQKYKNGGLKLWKNFKEEIYNFSKEVYNFTFNFQCNKLICVDKKEAPFIFSVYSFEESYFNKSNNKLLKPDFFISLVENTKKIKEEEIELFLHFESFSNIICFWAKTKNASSGYVFTIIFVDFNNKKCLEFVEIIFKAKNKYLFKKNVNTDEIYIFNLTEELLFIYSFKEKNSKSVKFTSEDLLFTKIHFCGNIKGIDFTENNGLVVLTEQNNLVCYSRNEDLFKSSLKEYNINNINKKDEENNDSVNQNKYDKLNNSLDEDDLKSLNNNLKKIFNKIDKKEKNVINNNKDLKKERKNNNIKNEKIEPKNLFNKNNIKSNDNGITNINNITNMKLDSYNQTPKDIEKEKNFNLEEKCCQTNQIYEEEDELSEDNKDNNDESKSLKEEKDENEDKDDKNDESKSIEEENDENEDYKKKLLEREKEQLEKKYKSYLKQKEIIDRFKTTNSNKEILNKTIQLFKNNITNLENEVLKDIYQFKPNEKYDEINSNISNLNKRKNSKIKYDYDKIDIALTKAKHCICQAQLFITDINRVRNKIMETTKKNIDKKNLKKNKDRNNCDYESVELINNCINIEFKNKKEIKTKIENLLYECNMNDSKINNIFEINSLSKSIDNKLKFLLNKCRNDIDKICELYKYNKFSQKEENEFINGIINPFLNFFDYIIKDYESKINIVSNEIDMFNRYKNSKKERAHFFCENKYINKLKKEGTDDSRYGRNLGEMISNYLEEIYEENNFYTTKGILIDYKCINIDEEFKDDK